jgi:hypothetical protein
MMNDKMDEKYAEWRWWFSQNYGPHVNTEIAKVLDETEAEIKRLEARCDNLLAALKLALDLQENGLVDFCKYGISDDSDIAKIYRAAIAKAEAQ